MKANSPRRDRRSARQRAAWPHVRDRGPAHGLSRPHVLPGEATRRPVRWPTSKWARTSYDDLDRVREFARNVSSCDVRVRERSRGNCRQPRPSILTSAPPVQFCTSRRTGFARRHSWTKAGIPVTPFTPVDCYDALKRAIDEHGCPAILKTAGFGYDGKGQVFIPTPGECWMRHGMRSLAALPCSKSSSTSNGRSRSLPRAAWTDRSPTSRRPQRASSPDSGSFRSRPRRFRTASRIEPWKSPGQYSRNWTSSACFVSSSSLRRTGTC